MREDGLYAALVRRGMSRRAFLEFSAAMAAALALPASYAPRIAAAVTAAPRLPVIWLRGQACGGNTEAFLRSADPSVAALLLETLSIDYQELLAFASGSDAELARTTAMERYPNGYFAVVEGAIPSGASGGFCLVGGRPIGDVVREVCDGAVATIAAGSCAFDGGAPAAAGGLTGAGGIRGLVKGERLVALPGCPLNVVNLVAAIVHYLTFRELPPRDPMGRPLAAYGGLIHNQCERRPYFEFGEFALAWGDEGAQKGWCLYKLGCKGPETMANCPTVRYGGGTSWNVGAGHGCIGCVMPNFWDAMGPAYRRLPSPVPFLPNLTVDTVGIGMVGGIGGVAGLHAVGMSIRTRRAGATARRRAASMGTPGSPGHPGPDIGPASGASGAGPADPGSSDGASSDAAPAVVATADAAVAAVESGDR